MECVESTCHIFGFFHFVFGFQSRVFGIQKLDSINLNSESKNEAKNSENTKTEFYVFAITSVSILRATTFLEVGLQELNKKKLKPHFFDNF